MHALSIIVSIAAAANPYNPNMATKTITVYTDDLDGTELPAGSRSTRFSFDGIEYEIDLSNDNRQSLSQALEPFIASARRVGTAQRSAAPRARGSKKADAERLSAIRTWAQGNGYTVGDRGRIKAEIVDAYDAAN